MCGKIRHVLACIHGACLPLQATSQVLGEQHFQKERRRRTKGVVWWLIKIGLIILGQRNTGLVPAPQTSFVILIFLLFGFDVATMDAFAQDTTCYNQTTHTPYQIGSPKSK